MKVVTTDGFDYNITRSEEAGLVCIEANEDALSALDDTITLAGISDDNSVYVKTPNSRHVHEGTAAMWLQFEFLNFN